MVETSHLKSFIRYLLTEKNYSQHTAIAYRNDVEQFYRYLYSMQADKDSSQTIEPAHIGLRQIRSWLAEMAINGLTTSTILRKLSSVRSYFRYLRRMGIIQHSPAANLQSPKKAGRKLPHFLDAEKMIFLLEKVNFPPDYKGIRNKTMLELMFATGVRVSELINLTTQSIDFTRNLLSVSGKGNKERLLPIGPHQTKQLKTYLAIRNETFGTTEKKELFLSNKGNSLYAKFVYRLTTQYLSYVTTKAKKNPHVLRHTFATVLLNNGASINAIKRLLGHSNLAATQVYTHTTIETLQAAYRQAHPKGGQTN